MSSSNKTPLGFNIWSGTDTPKREDFNADNLISDTEIARLDDRIDNIVLPENVAIKDGTLQTNLNAEMLGGKKIDEIASKANFNPNILHNWYFKNPVNQKSVSGTFSTIGQYFIDRWKLTSGTVILTENGLTLNGTIIQPLEYPAGSNVFASVKMYSGTATTSYDNSTKVFTIASNGGTIESAKLEIGTVSTLSSDPPQDYGVELAKCQRYQLAFSNYARFRLNSYTASLMRFSIPVPVTIRITPILSINPIIRTLAGVSQADFTFASFVPRPNSITIEATKTTHGLTDAEIEIPTGFIFDANL